MATFKSSSLAEYQIVPGTGTGLSAAVPRPDSGGIPATGDTIFHILTVANAVKSNFLPPSGFSLVTWVVGVADSFGVPALGIYKKTYSSAPDTESWTYNQNATRGAGISAVCYSGDCTIQQTQTSSATSASGSRNGPSMNAPVGNLVVAFFGGSAVTNPGVTWGNSFAERLDKEFYGIMSVGDLAGDGTAKTPALTPVDPSQSMWLTVDLGANVSGGGGGGGATHNAMLLGVG